MNPIEAKDYFHNYKDKPFREHQAEAVEYILNSPKRWMIVEAPTGCHDPHQRVLMADGSVKEAKDISVYDKLLNECGKVLAVTRIIGGYGKMFTIIPTKGESWTVNEDHVLTLKRTVIAGRGRKIRKDCRDGEIIDVSLKQWLGWSKTQKHIYKLVRSEVKSFDVQQKKLPINPYMLGLLLGDGTMINSVVGVCTADNEIFAYVSDYTILHNLKIRQSKSNPYSYYFSKEQRDNKKMKILLDLETLGLAGCRGGEKFIPNQYKTSSQENRLKILAGLIDTDGSVDGGGIDYISKSKRLADDVTFLSRSLGLAAYVTSCKKGCQGGFVGNYYRVSISGDCSIIPCKIRRKKVPPRKQKKNVLVTGFSVQEKGMGKFVGWELDGNGRYLLDDFTVTHNSGKSLIAMAAGMASGSLTYTVHSKVLQHQIVDDFPESHSLFGRANYPCNANPSLGCDECFKTEVTPCTSNSGCAYDREKDITLRSKLKVLNYDYLLSEANYVGRFSGAPFLVIDEADNLENTLINFVTLTFTSYALSRLGMEGPARKTATSKLGIDPWIEFGKEAQRKIMEILRGVDREISNFRVNDQGLNDEQMRALKERARVFRLLEKVSLFLNNVDKTWIFDSSQEGKYIFRPLWLTPQLAENFLWRHGRKWVLMSASFLPTTILAKTLGMDTAEMDYLCLPSTFPPERRQIHIIPAANLTSKTMDTEVPKLIEKIKEILKNHPNEKGLIHAVSYKLCQQIIGGVNSSRLITHNGQNRQARLEEFIDSNEPLVLISPSMERGVNLPMDLCRFIIVAKAPFLSLGDRIVSSRVYSGPIGNLWYAAQMLLTVLQMTGRGMRSKDDKCVTYILDEQFSRTLAKRPSLLPNWWKEGIA